jgi:hypothetical protein
VPDEKENHQAAGDSYGQAKNINRGKYLLFFQDFECEDK